MMIKPGISVALALLVAGCGGPGGGDGAEEFSAEAMADNMERQADELERMADQALASTPELTTDKMQGVCKAAVARLFGHSPKIMKASTAMDVTRVSYRRPDDGKLFTNDCQLEGNKVMWRSVNSSPGSGPGPWRVRADDEVITFIIEGPTVKLTTRYSDGSVTTESQPLV